MLSCISIDAHGGDFGLDTTLPACLNALEKFNDISLILVGDKEKIEQALNSDALSNLAKKHQDRYNTHNASQIVGMDEDIKSALRNKRDSSMRVALTLVKDNTAQACVSAGNSGALMAVSKMVLKTIDGIDRPAMFAKLPTIANKHTHMLDLGANIDSKANTLLGFAIMGSITVQYIDKIDKPRVGLLNIGSEDIKGKEITKQTAQLLKDNALINYVGFIEANTIYTEPVDLVVCDGYEGNLVLKASEGVATLMKTYLKRSFSKNIFTKLAALISLPALKHFKSSLDPRTYNGASLLGLKGVVIKSHGGADSFAFFHAIADARLSANNQITTKIQAQINKELSNQNQESI